MNKQEGRESGKVVSFPIHSKRTPKHPPTVTIDTRLLFMLENQLDALKYTLDRINDLKYTLDATLFLSGVRPDEPNMDREG